MASPQAWRRIVDDACDPAFNMAADEALLNAARLDPDALPTLRLYGWSAPTAQRTQASEPGIRRSLSRWWDSFSP